MERLMSVPDLINRYGAEMERIGYTEELFEHLVTIGELEGEYDPYTGELKVDRAVTNDLIAFGRSLLNEGTESEN